MSSPERSGLPSRPARTSGGSEEKPTSVTESSGQHENVPTAPKASSSDRGISSQNEGSKSVKEEPANLATWDAFHYHLLKFWGAFGIWNNRQILKNISASPQVLRTYHDSFLYGKVPLSVKARTTLRAGPIGAVWNLVEFVLALLSGLLYVYSAYRTEARHKWAYRVQNIISFMFIADYILRVYCEPVRLYFIFSFWGLIDLLSCVPVILVFRNHMAGNNLLKLLQFVRLVRVFSLTSKVSFFGSKFFGSSVTQQITLLTISTFVILFLDAGILHWVEYHLAPPSVRNACSLQGCITFWQSIYFLIVTVSTVGYGDITPNTIIGQLVAIITIIGALTILPIQIGRITALAFRRPYGGSFRSSKIVGSRFLIISGSITFTAVQSFLAEFYNPTHCEDLEVYPLRVIILAPFSPSFELKQILHLYNGLVEFIEGSPVRQSDLERVSANRAAAFFLLADKEAENDQIEDSAQVVRALAVHRYCLHTRGVQRRVRIIVEVLDPETHSSAIWDDSLTDGVEVICPVKVHYKMMARSCAVHGLYTLITNLFTSELQLKYMNRKHFLSEYFHSFDNEVYPVILPESFHGLVFEEVADFIFVNFRSVLFALDTIVGFKSTTGEPDRKVLLFPKGHLIQSDDVGMIIASDLHTAYAISTHGPKEDAAGLLHQLWVRGTTAPHIKRENQGTELYDPNSGRWRRTRSSASKAYNRGTSGMRSAAFGEKGPGAYPGHHDGHKLEYQLRTEIQNVYSQQHYPDWGKAQPAAAEIGILEGGDIETPELESHSKQKPTLGIGKPATESRHRFPKGMSLEKAASDLLAWPPASYNDRPHPAVLEEKEEVILNDLKERTITMVAFNVPHILVCCQSGWPHHFFYFMVEIRKPGFANPPVVILYPKEINAKQWGTVGAFKDVYFLKGSPQYELDLLRGGVLQAEKIVILSNRGVPVDLRGDGDGDEKMYLKRSPAAYTSDVENIIIAANVQRLFGHASSDNVIVEMQHSDGFFYLRPQYEISKAHFPKTGFERNRDAMVHFGPPFMEGKAVSAAMLGFLMRASFYNQNTQTIVNQFIEGGYKKTDDGGLNDERVKVLDQIRLPEQYGNRPYSELFLGFLREKGVLVIGLYRVRGTLGAPTSYVLTNPLPDCIVNPDDLVYVIY